MNPKKTDEYYHNKNNIDEIYSTASTEHYIDLSRKKGIAVICMFVALVAFYFIGRQWMANKSKPIKEDRVRLLGDPEDNYYHTLSSP